MNVLGPNYYPNVSCHFMHFFGNMIIIQFCLLFAAIIVVKYLFVLFFKNPTSVQGDFWKVGVKQEEGFFQYWPTQASFWPKYFRAKWFLNKLMWSINHLILLDLSSCPLVHLSTPLMTRPGLTNWPYRLSGQHHSYYRGLVAQNLF